MKELPKSIAKILNCINNNQAFILTDDEDRENEGDVILSMDAVNPESIKFLMQHCRGMICLAMEENRVNELKLSKCLKRGSIYDTPFLRSIDAVGLPDNGISASDISKTIKLAENGLADGFVTPGHVAPLEAKAGGVLVRTGHTEASIDLMRLAGKPPMGVICEIMGDDGTMIKGKQLKDFSELFNLPILSIAELISWRLKHDRFVKKISKSTLDNKFGTFEMSVYRTLIAPYTEHLVFQHKLSNVVPPLVRVHMFDMLSDVCHDDQNKRDLILDSAFNRIAKEENGLLLIINNNSKTALSQSIEVRNTMTINHGNGQQWLREYGIGAQILLDMKITKMRLLSNSAPSLVAFSAFGLEVIEHVSMYDNFKV